MPFASRAASSLRKTVAGRALLRLRRQGLTLARYGRDIPGLLALMGGGQPTLKGTSYLSIQQWRAALSEVAPPSKVEIAIFAIQNKTWVKWAIYAGCQVLRLGYRPVIVFSSTEMSSIYPSGGIRGFATAAGYSFWRAALRLSHFRFVDLDDYLGEESVEGRYAEFAEDWAHTSVAYEMGVEEREPGELAVPYGEATKTSTQLIRRYAAAIDQMLVAQAPSRVICPSGLIGHSIGVFEACRRQGVKSCYVEAWGMRPGHMTWNFDNPALEYDIPGWMAFLEESSETVVEHSQQFMSFQERARTKQNESLRDNYRQVQRTSLAAPWPEQLGTFLERDGTCFLLGTNVIGDSATFRRATFFQSQREWVEEVVGFFVKHPDLNLIFRAHPDEVTIKAVQRLGDVAAAAAGDAENILVLHGHDDVNTYSLLEKIDVGLAWVSNIGLDMALRGLPVVLAARSAYGDLGLCDVPQSRPLFFRALLEQGKKPRPPTAKAILDGKKYQTILTRLLSLEASVPGWNAANFRLGPEYDWPEQRRFYGILAGDLDDKGRA
jgi:hypothetical protein